MMKSTATTRTVGEIISDVKEGKLIPKPKFQRRLVWRNADKIHFLDTVLKGYPFPEIYVAASTVDTETAITLKDLVDGQQRVTTLLQYFEDSKLLEYEGLKRYQELTKDEKEAFLGYVVVVRDLGKISNKDLIETFKRLNATDYGLNDYEKQNAEYNGEFKKISIRIAENAFFEKHKIFTANDVRRMLDAQYVAAVMATVMSDYFTFNNGVTNYLERYNDEFPSGKELENNLNLVLDKINECRFPEKSRVWNKSDFFTLLVELFRYLITSKKTLTEDNIADLKTFYSEVDSYANDKNHRVEEVIVAYHAATVQGANNRDRRIRRGDVIKTLLNSGLSAISKTEQSKSE